MSGGGGFQELSQTESAEKNRRSRMGSKAAKLWAPYAETSDTLDRSTVCRQRGFGNGKNHTNPLPFDCQSADMKLWGGGAKDTQRERDRVELSQRKEKKS